MLNNDEYPMSAFHCEVRTSSDVLDAKICQLKAITQSMSQSGIEGFLGIDAIEQDGLLRLITDLASDIDSLWNKVIEDTSPVAH